MIDYSDLLHLTEAGQTLAGLERATGDILGGVAYRALPEAYGSFLKQLGWGTIGDQSFMIYSGPVEVGSIYPSLHDLADTVLLFGDDFAGYVSGIRLADGMVVEFGPSGRPEETGLPFEAYIRRLIDRADHSEL